MYPLSTFFRTVRALERVAFAPQPAHSGELAVAATLDRPLDSSVKVDLEGERVAERNSILAHATSRKSFDAARPMRA